MYWFKNLKVRNKLLIAFTLVIALAACVGVFIISSMKKVSDSYSDAMDVSSRRFGSLFEAKDHFSRAHTIMYEVFSPGNNRADISRLKGELDESLDGFVKNLVDLNEIAAPVVRDKIEQILPMAQEYRIDAELAIDLLLSVSEVSSENPDYRKAAAAAGARVAEMNAKDGNSLSDAIVHLSVTAVGDLNSLASENNAYADSVLYVSIGMFGVVASLSLAIAFWVPSLISKPLIPLSEFMKKAGSTGNIELNPGDAEIIGAYSRQGDEIGDTIKGAAMFIQHVTNISEELKSVANGDLTIEISRLSDEDTMASSISDVLDNLNNMFGEIRDTTDQVSGGSRQVAVGAQTLAQGSTEQAASIQELSSSVAEIASKTRANADTAEKTSKLSEKIKASAEKGSRQMDEMIAAVKDINDASHSISKIIKTIDDIAFQTNILALNAAVEAARAGQHGKGFAVVAEEVRNLAAKSAEAAKETGDKIQNSMEKAEFGSNIAGETAVSLTEIVSGINESSRYIAEIAKASEEQTNGISLINVGIDQVAQVVAQNSATAEQSAAASEEMNSQAEALEELIGLFKLKGKTVDRGTGHMTAAAPPSVGPHSWH